MKNSSDSYTTELADEIDGATMIVIVKGRSQEPLNKRERDLIVSALRNAAQQVSVSASLGTDAEAQVEPVDEEGLDHEAARQRVEGL